MIQHTLTTTTTTNLTRVTVVYPLPPPLNQASGACAPPLAGEWPWNETRSNRPASCTCTGPLAREWSFSAGQIEPAAAQEPQVPARFRQQRGSHGGTCSVQVTAVTAKGRVRREKEKKIK
ncbi:hypothetical protein Patl1_13472 [Pistacia atlantica]|uniref:Uncharacterized protein n=1 Tax=Pistacia atlantica TaxID=434234 RepID=A0ACC1ATT6_9ROSI|nr:hypothetical protein Patl1_13472 [Pistacia atlantica]